MCAPPVSSCFIMLWQDHRYWGEIADPAPSISRHGAQFGGLRVFTVIKIIVVHQVRVLPACTAVWVWRQNAHKTLCGVQRSWTHLFCVCFCSCSRQKPEDPQIQPHCWRCHTGWYRKSGISLLCLWTRQWKCGYYFTYWQHLWKATNLYCCAILIPDMVTTFVSLLVLVPGPCSYHVVVCKVPSS